MQSSNAQTITLNGEVRVLPSGQTLAQLVATLELTGKAVAVAVNRKVVRACDWQACQLVHGDKVDVVRAIGGG